PKLCEIASAASICTHAHPTGIASGIATAYLTALAVSNTPPENMIQLLCKLPECNDTDFIRAIRKIPDALKHPNEEQAIESLGMGWTGKEAVAIALYSFLKSQRDYKATVLRAVNHSGDSDSTACIAGAFSGAYNGFNAIPKEWTERIENRQGLEQTTTELLKKHKKQAG
ncbi:MAG: ADP-ribosylglycohydrolase family protein, partial [Nanoarchaeota archaeon]|nr:ADP-ribosylglycohydrolase family protein [Nanoarchaeota archaeon]